MLRAFKDSDHGTTGSGGEEPVVPFLMESNLFAGAYGTSHSFYRSNDVLRFGPIEPAYEQMLATLAGWYAEGLIDPRLGDENRFSGSRLIEALGKCGSTIMNLANMPFLSPLKLMPAPPPVMAESGRLL